MNLRLRLAAVLLLLGLTSIPALAVGTSSQTNITNGVFNTGDTIPQAAGRLSIGFKISSTISDSRYVGFNSSGVSVAVDTGYDLKLLNSPADTFGSPGDTMEFAYLVTNLGNATIDIYLDTFREGAGLSDTNWGVTAYHIFNDDNSDSDYDAGEPETTRITVAAGAARVIVVTIAVPTTASDGDSSHITLSVTNDAPKNSSSVTGDGWEGGVPISGNDATDTQYDTIVTRVRAPNVYVSKGITEATSTNSRPGDTLVMAITFDNDGSDSARGVEIYDAVPANTRYVPWSADSVELPNQWSFNGLTGYSDTAYRVYYDSSPVGQAASSFVDTISGNGSNVTAVKWSINQIVGATSSDAAGTVNFSQSVNDNGRVYFRVTIQ